jgi:pimeloyl-ACP methyl ester carboxylesterase
VTGAKRHFVELEDVTLSVREWGDPAAPNLVLVPGTGLPSELFLGVEQMLASDWHGYSFDRRGQGQSSTPDTGWDFADFARDLRLAMEALGIEDAVGIGHSAGGTDMLMAAAAEGSPFTRLLIMEPTLQDPRLPPLNETRPPTWERSLMRARRRRIEYPSVIDVIERWRDAPNFQRARPALFRAYVEAAFEPTEAGTIRLRCLPEVERAMVRPIMQVFERRYRAPDGRPDPFRPLLDLAIPVTLTTSEFSGGYYAEMVQRGVSMLPNARHVHLAGVGHLVPLEQPEAVVELLEAVPEPTRTGRGW